MYICSFFINSAGILSILLCVLSLNALTAYSDVYLRIRSPLPSSENFNLFWFYAKQLLPILQYVPKYTVLKIWFYNVILIKQKIQNINTVKCTGISSFIQKCVLNALHYILHKVHNAHRDCQTYV